MRRTVLAALLLAASTTASAVCVQPQGRMMNGVYIPIGRAAMVAYALCTSMNPNEPVVVQPAPQDNYYQEESLRLQRQQVDEMRRANEQQRQLHCNLGRSC